MPLPSAAARLLSEVIMSNETIVSGIVRRHFEKYGDEVTIEEQSSDNSEIASLLSKSSKDRTGNPGRPDFIITFKNAPGMVCLVECKADVRKHDTEDKKRSEGLRC